MYMYVHTCAPVSHVHVHTCIYYVYSLKFTTGT